MVAEAALRLTLTTGMFAELNRLANEPPLMLPKPVQLSYPAPAEKEPFDPAVISWKVLLGALYKMGFTKTLALTAAKYPAIAGATTLVPPYTTY